MGLRLGNGPESWPRGPKFWLRIYQYMPWDGTEYPSSKFVMVHSIPAQKLGQYITSQLGIWDGTFYPRLKICTSTYRISHNIPAHNVMSQNIPVHNMMSYNIPVHNMMSCNIPVHNGMSQNAFVVDGLQPRQDDERRTDEYLSG